MSTVMASATAHVATHITKQPGVCGGKASIDDTRVRVNNVAFLHKQGLSLAQIREQYPQLSPGQVHAAIGYYYDHTDEIEAELARDEGFEERLDRAKAEHLAGREQR
jgi:uncharacterized protein (DUF433 family)